MLKQPEFPFDGETLKEVGMQRAVDHADEVIPSWSEKAFELLKKYIKTEVEFTGEQFRHWAYSKGLEYPPSERAFGSIILRAARANLIRRVGFIQVTNRRAHRANAGLWRTIK